MLYESYKHDDSLPLIGVNIYMPNKGEAEEAPEIELIRATEAEKCEQISCVRRFQQCHAEQSAQTLKQLHHVAHKCDNLITRSELVKVTSMISS